MTSRVFELVTIAVLATALWIVPSVGTRGQGTLGDRFVHADRGLVASDAAGRDSLLRADAVALKAVNGL
jgi:hypothetical protein